MVDRFGDMDCGDGAFTHLARGGVRCFYVFSVEALEFFRHVFEYSVHSLDGLVPDRRGNGSRLHDTDMDSPWMELAPQGIAEGLQPEFGHGVRAYHRRGDPTADGAHVDDTAFGLSQEDLDLTFSAGRYLKPNRGPLREIAASARQTYCSSMGFEILHIQNRAIRRWLIENIETNKLPEMYQFEVPEIVEPEIPEEAPEPEVKEEVVELGNV